MWNSAQGERPQPMLLPPNERRRAPDTVALALAVAQAACTNAGRDPALLPTVFASTYGDMAITDYMCGTLARAPTMLSPTRFHNSVHNAAAGYWSIATGCRQPYCALGAGAYTFAAGLFAAALQACADETDVLLVAYGSGWGAPEGGLIAIQPGPATYAVPASMSYQSGDRVIATPQTRASPCSLNLTSISQAPTATTVTVALGLVGAANGVLFDLGRTPRFNVYAVRSGRLTLCDYLTQDCTSTDAKNWTELTEGIVSLRAQYARDTSSPNRDAAADTFDQSTPTSACGWGRIVGVRVAMVARGRQPDKTDVTSAAPTWSGSASTPIELTGGDWKLYRYKTFDTTVPLRNTPLAANTDFLTCTP